VKLITISDIHILNEQDPIYDQLLRMIDQEIQSGDHLVLAGDIFDFLVGRPIKIQKRYGQFFSLLKKVGERGASIHYIEGNHDFHLRNAFDQIPGFKLYPAEITLECEGKKFYIAHGDLVDQKDKGYLFLRGLFRHPLTYVAAQFLPEFAVDAIGARSGELSHGKRKKTPSALLQAKIDRTRKVFRLFAEAKTAHGFDFVILGHCHDADEMKFTHGKRVGHYMNVGFPKEHQSYIRWTSGDTQLTRTKLD